MEKERKKTWDEKCHIVYNSYSRCTVNDHGEFAAQFYENLFFLKKELKEYFKDTDFDHQKKALMIGLKHLVEYSDHTNKNARVQILRLAKSHSSFNLNIHPHNYYYWLEALINTVRITDDDWYDDLEYYWREVISFPIMFMISQYFNNGTDLD